MPLFFGLLNIGMGHAATALSQMIGQRIEPTLWLTLLTITFAVVLAVPMGIVAAWKVGTWIDRTLMALAVMAFSLPVFLIGYLFIFGFSIKLAWLPVQGFHSLREGFGPFIKHLIQGAIEAYPTVPLVMHQDHGQSPDVCKGAIDLGFSSVMMDGSLQADGKTIASYEYNVDVTKKVVAMAHALGVTVEGELGCLGSLETMKGDKEDGHGAEGTMTREQLYGDIQEIWATRRKTIIFVSQGPPTYVGSRTQGNLQDIMRDILREANRGNVMINVVDPVGLSMEMRLGDKGTPDADNGQCP